MGFRVSWRGDIEVMGFDEGVMLDLGFDEENKLTFRISVRLAR